MAKSLPIAEPTPTPDAAVAQVRQALFGVLGPDANAPYIEDAAREAVAELWDRPIRTFVPVLAARAVRDQFAPAPERPPVPFGAVATRRPDHTDERALDPDDGLVLDPRDDLVVDLGDGLSPD